MHKSYRARHHDDQLLLPGPGVGAEAGTVGTAIDYRLRLAFTTIKPNGPVANVRRRWRALAVPLVGQVESDPVRKAEGAAVGWGRTELQPAWTRVSLSATRPR
ncbi:hypothetical protein [Streptomyces sp. NPDC005799]|uniref:hypothetical protein n=1 Tax=Streptomyces sp. NPDC005799 TaxID=3154678 RepID=UPI0033DE7616